MANREDGFMARCVTCGSELHPERALKYNYCMAPECQEKNLKGLTMVAVGMNKAADEFLLLDDETREDLASGKYRDQRRGFYGSISTADGTTSDSQRTHPPHRQPARRPQPVRRSQPTARTPWTRSQEKLALLYNEQGMRPTEIAAKLGVSAHLVTQIILAAKNRGKS